MHLRYVNMGSLGLFTGIILILDGTFAWGFVAAISPEHKTLIRVMECILGVIAVVLSIGVLFFYLMIGFP